MHHSLQILGSGVPSKTWEAIIEHANNCIVDDDKLYGYNQAPYEPGLLFNSVYKVVGATFDGQSVTPLDKLTADQKVSFVTFMSQTSPCHTNRHFQLFAFIEMEQISVLRLVRLEDKLVKDEQHIVTSY